MVLNKLREADTDIRAASALVNESVEYLSQIKPECIDALYKDSIDKAQRYYNDLAKAMERLKRELQRLEIIV